MRKQTSSASEIIFSIVSLIDKIIRNDSIYFAINGDLSDFKNDKVKYERPIQRVSEIDGVGRTRTDGTGKWKSGNDRPASKKPRFISK